MLNSALHELFFKLLDVAQPLNKRKKFVSMINTYLLHDMIDFLLKTPVEEITPNYINGLLKIITDNLREDYQAEKIENKTHNGHLTQIQLMMSTVQILKKLDFLNALAPLITKFEKFNEFKIMMSKLIVSFIQC